MNNRVTVWYYYDVATPSVMSTCQVLSADVTLYSGYLDEIDYASG